MSGKNLNFFTGIMLMACIFFLCGSASAATSVSVLPSVETVTPGEEFTLDIYIKPDTPIAGVQFDLDFDGSLVAINSIEEGDFFSSTGSPVMFNPGTIDNDEGAATLIYGALIMGDGTSDEGTFCTIKMIADEQPGNCQIRIENIVVGDDQGDELDAITYDALVSISDEIEPSGRNNDNDDDTELNIIEKSSTDSADNEVAASEEETTLQSVQDTAENTGTQGTAFTPEAESSTSNISILVIAAIAFLAMAYVLDRKRK